MPVTLADVQVMKNGQPIPLDQETRKHLQVEQNGPKDIRLSVKDARLSDTGDYSALIHGTIQPIIQLDVQPREMQNSNDRITSGYLPRNGNASDRLSVSSTEPEQRLSLVQRQSIVVCPTIVLKSSKIPFMIR